MPRSKIEETLRDKVCEILAKMEYFKEALHGSIFFLGGSAVAASNPNDIDIFFQFREYVDDAIRWVDSRITVVTEKEPIDNRFRKVHNGENAYTFKCPTSDIPFQFIRKLFAGLEAMIDSFDFAHIQAGVEVIEIDGKFKIMKAHWTPAYEKSLEMNDSWYMGSDNPFSALFRLSKYYAKGELSILSLKTQVIKILNDILEQGYTNERGSHVIREQLSLIGISDVLADKNSHLFLRNSDVSRLIGNLAVLEWFKLFRK